MLELWIEPVLTAHPTESTRRTHSAQTAEGRAIAAEPTGVVAARQPETRTIWERVRAEITSGWQTAENSRERLTHRG